MKYTLPLLCLSLFLLNCSHTPDEASQAPVKQPSLKYAQGFAHEVFQDDQRKNIILSQKEEIDRLFRKRSDDMHYPGQAYGIVVDNELVLTGEMGVLDIEKNIPATTQSYFRIASMSKSFTAMAIMHLRDQGLLNLDDPVSVHIPEMSNLSLPTEDSPVIIIKNLLTMTGGFPEDNPWGDRQLDVSNQDLSNFISGDVSFSTTPATQYEYSNLGYALLGNIITRISGKPYQQYITENILTPLGMDHTVYEYEDAPDSLLAKGYRWEEEQWKSEPMLHDGVYGAMGGMITTIEDFAKYVSFHLSAWPVRNGEDEGPLKRSSLREMHQMTMPSLAQNSKGLKGQDCPSVSGYAFGLRITQYCDGSWSAGHGGALPGFSSYYLFYPEYGVGIMAFNNLTYTSPAPVIRDVAAHIFGQQGIEKRQLPVSNVLKERKDQVYKIITTWDNSLDGEVIAMNFYLDKSKELRKKDAEEKLAAIGKVLGTSEMTPFNQLRGTFEIYGETDTLEVFFTLSPEKVAKIQRVDIRHP